MNDIEGILYGTTETTKVVEAQVKTSTTVEIKDHKTGKVEEIKQEENVLSKKLMDGTPAYLSIKYSSTIPLGEFRMCRVEKSLFVPIGIEAHPEIQAKIEATNQWGCSLLEKLMEKEVTEALAEKNKGQTVVKKEEDLLFG